MQAPNFELHIGQWNPARMSPQTSSYIFRLSGIFFLCVLSASVVSPASFTTAGIPALRLSAAISMAAVLLFGREMWPAIFAGALGACIIRGYALIPSLGIALRSAIEPLVSSWLLTWAGVPHPRFGRLRDVRSFVATGALAGPAAAIAFSIAFQRTALGIPLSEILHARSTWLSGDAVSILLLVPLILAWREPLDRKLGIKSLGLAAGALAALAAIDELVFSVLPSNSMHAYVVGYIVFPFLMWIALQLGPQGATLGLLVTAVIATSNTVAGRGPFAAKAEPTLALYLFLGVLAITTLIIAASISEHRQTASSLQRSQEQLRVSEERYRDLFENAQDFIVTLDVEGRFTSANNAVLQVSGYTTEEFVKMTIDDVITERSRELAWSAFRRILGGERPQSPTQLEMVCKDATTLLVEISSRRLVQNGKTVGLQSIGRDISWRKRLEEELLRSQKMEAVGRLAGGVAHDFNNLLGVILGYSDLGLQELNPGDPLRRNLNEIRKAGKRAAEVTQQLLAFSRKQVLDRKVVDLNAIVGETNRMLLRLLGEDIAVITKMNPTPVRVETDPAQLQQVIINLALNARDAMPHGGKLVIETSSVVLDRGHGWTAFEQLIERGVLVVPGRYVLLAVTDTGLGMDEQTRAKIFDPFFTTKPTGEGTGLGLATTYGFVRQSGGYIWVYSEVGHGTTFKIYLPEVTVDRHPMEPKEVVSLPKGTETILLVEDEQSLRELNQQLLQALGYTVLSAGNGVQALEINDKHEETIHLLLTDVVMPGMCGRELAERLAITRPETKVLYMSGYTDSVIVQHGILKEGIAFLQKPFTQEALARKLQEILGHSE